ncbi:uncharacterized protein [Henckelia pumila]|uniref:uncharacterized protein n=1 Tax=Henckelia pumila TaxID=405737 RepID=UPI003C6E3CFA
MSRACITGITCLAFLCGGFWVLEYGTRRLRNRRLKKVIPVLVTTTHHKRGVDTLVEGGIREEDRISQLMPINSPPCNNLKSQTKFVQAVDTFLQHHSGSRITSFDLVCCFRGSISEHFRRWVNTVVAPSVFGKVAQDLPNLKCMYFWTDARFFENNLDLLALTTILDACPLLHYFHLSMTTPSTFNGIRAQKRVVRHHTRLKELEFSGFNMTENEYNFIFYVLKSAVFLERLSIFLDVRFYHILLESWLCTTCTQGDWKEKQRVIRKRLRGHAISKNAEIIITK